METRSNFDDYSKEILSGELEWTPMHRSIAFWDKNVHKFLEKDMIVLKTLIEYIKPGGNIESKVRFAPPSVTDGCNMRCSFTVHL